MSGRPVRSGRVRIVVAGTGQQGQRHARTVMRSPEAELVATADPMAPGLPGVPHFDRFEDAVVGHRPDAVIVATATESHVAIGRAAVDAGLPTLVEKPVAGSVEQAELLVATADLAGVTLAAGHVERFNPSVQLVRDMLRSGTLGRPIAFSFRRVGLPPRRPSGIGVIHDLAVHDIDVFNVLAGGWSTLTGACGWPAPGLAESAHLLLHHGEMHGMVEVNWRTPVRLRSFTVTTDECFVEVNYTTQRVEITQASPLADFEEFASFQAHYGSARRTHLEPPPAEPLAAQLDAFVKAVRGEEPGLLATAHDGLAAVAVAEQAAALVASGAEVAGAERPGRPLVSGSVHKRAVIGPGVELGANVTIGPMAVVLGPAVIGDGVWIGPHAVIGTPPQVIGTDHWPADRVQAGCGVEIGAGSMIREFVAIQQGSERPTVVGRDCYVMAHTNVNHDCVVGDGVVLSNSVQLAGFVRVGAGANLGMGVVVHQHRAIGEHAMIGMQAAVTRDIPAFSLAIGIPARVVGPNRVGLERLGMTAP